MTDAGRETPLLAVKDLTKHFPVQRGVLSRQVGSVRAVDGVSFELWPGETLGLVGESGCGKTTAGRAILQLIEPTAGEVKFEGVDLVGLNARELRRRRRDMQIIFQDPFSSLNPRMRVRDIVGEALSVHGMLKGRKLERRVGELLDKVGVTRAFANRYPHEFSGGQRQRIGIARAIALNPKFIVCDEAVSALDVSIRAQVLNLLIELRQELSLSYLFISHDLSVVKHISNRIAVMYLGQIVELAEADELFERPAHPYTRSLLSAIPLPNPRRRTQRQILPGDVPTPLNPPAGCRFHTRCPAAFERCAEQAPPLVELGRGHRVHCHHAEGLDTQSDWFQKLDQRIADQERANQAQVAKKAASEVAAPQVSEVRALSQAQAGTEPKASDDSEDAEPDAEVSVLESDAPFIGERGARFLVILGLALVVLGYWALGVPLTLAAYFFGLRKRRTRPLAGDLGWAGLLLMALLVSSRAAEQDQHGRAYRELEGLAAQLESYRHNTGEYPESLRGLGWRLFEVLPNGQLVDPWQRDYMYEAPSDTGPGRLQSRGPDTASPDDDLVRTVSPRR